MIDRVEHDHELAEKAAELRRIGQYADAISIYTRLLSQYPIAELYSERGITHSAAGDLENAIADLRQAVQLRPDDVECLVNRGNAYLRAKMFSSAIEDYSTAIDLAPGLSHAYNGRGYAYAQMDMLQEAFDDLTHASELDQTQSAPYQNLGNMCFMMGRRDEALGYLDKANELRPGDASILALRADILKATGEFAKAKGDYEAAIQSDPQELRPRHRLAWLLSTCSDSSIRDGSAAVLHARICCEESGWINSLYLETLAAALVESGEFEEAIRIQSKAVELTSPERRDAAVYRLEQIQRHEPIRED